MLAQVVEAEVAEALAAHAHLITDDGRRRLVRHGHMPERTIQTGIGPMAVRQPRVRDRGGADGERIRFSSTLLPPYARRTKSLDALLPILYLRGISSGDMQEALSALLGKDAPNLSPTLQKFAAVHSSVHNHFNQERHLYSRESTAAQISS